MGVEAHISLTSSRNPSNKSEADSEELCWICHAGASSDTPIIKACECSFATVHQGCLGRWQLQQAGKPEEKECRFCHKELPDWRENHAKLPKANPIMTVVHGGRAHQLEVQEGPEGRENFERQIREIFGLKEDDQVSLTFGCKVPGSSSEVTLEGWNAFDAAVHCASVSAGQRIARKASEQALQRENSASEQVTSPRNVLRRLFSRGHSSGV